MGPIVLVNRHRLAYYTVSSSDVLQIPALLTTMSNLIYSKDIYSTNWLILASEVISNLLHLTLEWMSIYFHRLVASCGFYLLVA